MPKKTAHRYADVYQTFGIEFSLNGSTEVRAEECPWCGKNRFYVNTETSQYHCKHCDERGNVTTFLTWYHSQALTDTTPAHYSALGRTRGVAPQTLRLHQLAFATPLGCWLVPFRNAQENIANLLRYYPGRSKPNKFMLPGLPTSIYGFDRLAAGEKDKLVLLCEGSFDAIALDYHLKQNRSKYTVIATPGAFKEEWAPHFEGRRVLALYDNDEGGRQQAQRVQKLLGEPRITEELLVLKWPAGFPDGCDINDLVRDPGLGVTSIVGWARRNAFRVVPQPRLAWCHAWLRKDTGPEHIEWVWPNRLRCGTYASFSGKRGTFKSTIARFLVARYTVGEALPGCEQPGMAAGHVIYVTAEDGEAKVLADLDRFGANRRHVTVLPAVLKDGDPMNILEHLEELRQGVRQYGVRWVVIDGQNSVVGAPNISTDMLARNNITNKLHQFAQKENICLLGIRNEDTEGRAYGPASMNDLGRCILRAVDVGRRGNDRYLKLVFERISDAAPSTHPNLPYLVADDGGKSPPWISWEKVMPPPDEPASPEQAAQAKDLAAKLAAQGGKLRR